MLVRLRAYRIRLSLNYYLFFKSNYLYGPSPPSLMLLIIIIMSWQLITPSIDPPSSYPAFLFRHVNPAYVLFLLDAEYILKRKDHSPANQPFVKHFQERIRDQLLQGTVIGLALTLASRRYFPHLYETNNALRFCLEATFLGGSLLMSTLSIFTTEGHNIIGMKKQYVLARDPHILSYIYNLERHYRIDEESNMREFLDEEEIERWKTERFGFD